jgi:hypothetical protein
VRVKPEPVSVPVEEFPFVTPLTLQVRPVLLVPLTVAVRVRVPPKATVEAEVFSVRVIAACAVLPHQTHASVKAKHDSASFFIGLFPPEAL